MMIEDEELELKVGKCMQDCVKERSQRSKEDERITSGSQNVLDVGVKSTTGHTSTNAFSDDEDTGSMLSSLKSVGRGKKGPSDITRGGASKRGRGGGRSGSLKQMTLDGTMTIRQSERIRFHRQHFTIHAHGSSSGTGSDHISAATSSSISSTNDNNNHIKPVQINVDATFSAMKCIYGVVVSDYNGTFLEDKSGPSLCFHQ